MIKEILVKSVLNKKKKRDTWFLDEYTMNPYEGCSFNCQYCYVRGSKYGENMEESLSVKINTAEVLDRQLANRAKKNQYGIIALASATDPYIQIENRFNLTRASLELILKFRFPVLIITKSNGVLRDIDILRKIDKDAILPEDLRDTLKRGAIVSFSLCTLDESISSTLEPGAPDPKIRLQTMKACKEAGLLVGVNCIPTLPFISDSDEQLELIVSEAKDHGADYVLIGGLTLFGNQPFDSKTLYYKFLERRFPHLLKDYKKLYRIFFMPHKEYLQDLEVRTTAICNKYNIRKKIIE